MCLGPEADSEVQDKIPRSSPVTIGICSQGSGSTPSSISSQEDRQEERPQSEGLCF